MRPDATYIEIASSEDMIRKLIGDLYVLPRAHLLRWSQVTNQTAQVRIAYPGQHLASLVTGVRGSGTAARGEDLIDGSEVKSCSRTDQLGECKKCGARVLPSHESCVLCESDKINRKQDSHWILSMRTEEEFQQYLDAHRLVLVLFDRPEMHPSNHRIRVWEIWPSHERHKYYRWFVEDYWQNNYQEKLRRGLSPSPLNLHPLKQDFLRMNPVPTFRAHVEMETQAVSIDYWIRPLVDRSECPVESMSPSSVSPRSLVEELLESLPDEDLAECLEISVEEASYYRDVHSTAELMGLVSNITEEVRHRLPHPRKSPKMSPSTYRRQMRSR